MKKKNHTELRRRKRPCIRDRPVRRRGKTESYERPDYTVYRLSPAEEWKGAALYCALDAAVSCLFFDSAAVFLLLLPGYAVFRRAYRELLKKKRSAVMKRQFMDGLQMTASTLQAGYSIENAFRESLRELKKIYDPDSFIMREFQFLAVQIEMNRTVEELLTDLGKRSGLEEIRSFAEIVETAKRTGGNLPGIIRNTVACMRQRQETQDEIETYLAGKIMEQNVMSLVPVLILAYVRLTSPEFLDSMYGNVTGTAVMTICLIVYLTAVLWGKRMIRIEV